MRLDRRVEDGCTYDLTIATVFQDEAPYLKEWIEFHKMLGVQRFVLVDDRSMDGFRRIVAPYIACGDVVLYSRPCPEGLQGPLWPTYQCSVLQSLCEQLRGVTRWLALIDVDEFLVPSEADSLLAFLSTREQYGAVYVRWEAFGTSYVTTLPDDRLLTEAMTRKMRFIRGNDLLGKSIVKPHRVLEPNIHRSSLLEGFEYFDSNPGMQSEFPLIKLNHYWTRDEDYLVNCKLPRAANIKGWKIDDERVSFFKRAFNDVPDESMHRFIPALRQRVFGPGPDCRAPTAEDAAEALSEVEGPGCSMCSPRSPRW